MEIELIHKNQILDYARSCPVEFDSSIPITIPRAVSQSKNPYAEMNDTLLIVAREGNSLKAYIGILPGIVNGNSEKKVFWLSCWWRHREAGKEIPGKLFEKYLEISGNRAGLSHWPESLLKTAGKYNIPIHSRQGVLFRFRWGLHPRSLSYSLTKKSGRILKFARNLSVFSGVDSFLNSAYPYPKIQAMNGKNELTIFNDLPPHSFFEFIGDFSGRLSQPDKEMIEWIHNNPWLVSTSKAAPSIASRYHFSYVASDFHFFYPVLTQKEEIVAAGMFSSVSGVVKSVYLYYRDENKHVFFKSLLSYLQAEKRYHSLLTYEPGLSDYLKSSYRGTRGIKGLTRYFGTSGDAYAHFTASDGDGDTCFT